MALLGNWEQGLDRLIARAHELATRQAHEKLTERARDVIESQMKREFRTGVGADGVAFPQPKDGGTPMVRSGDLRRSASATVEDPLTVKFGFGKPYAKIQQRRGRALIPTNGLGVVWGPRILGSLRQLLGKILRQGAK